MPTDIPRLSDTILIGHVQTPLEGATVFTPDTPKRSALRLLEEGNFDQAPVLKDDVPIGYVLARDLTSGRGSLDGVIKPILPRAIASETAPLEDALPWLDASEFLFMLRGQTIVGFVVPSDLNKQAGRGYIYFALTELEMRLAELVRVIARVRDPLDDLDAKQAKAVLDGWKRSRQANTEADIVAEMNLSHLFKIVGRDDALLRAIDVASTEDWDRRWRVVNEIRKRVAHSARPLVANAVDITNLRLAAEWIHDLNDRLLKAMPAIRL